MEDTAAANITGSIAKSHKGRDRRSQDTDFTQRQNELLRLSPSAGTKGKKMNF